MATIDVLLPVRNGMPFLGASIDSIKTQTFGDWRLLVLDHGSTDGSVELARRHEDLDSRIEVHSVPDARGLAGLLNYGLERCDCTYILRQDSDDISAPDRMKVTLAAFAERPDLALVGGEAITIDAGGSQVGYMRTPGSSVAITAASFFYNPIAHPTVTMNFAAIQRLGATYGKDIFQISSSFQIRDLVEDYFLFGQIALLGLCLNVRAPLIKYRIHDRSVSIASRADQTRYALDISRFLARSFCAIKNVPVFDPAPFCTHGEHVFDCGRKDYVSEFIKMASSLRCGLGLSPELDRELAFRWTLASRSSVRMSARCICFALRYGSRLNEMRVVRNWLLRNVRGKYVYKVDNGLIS